MMVTIQRSPRLLAYLLTTHSLAIVSLWVIPIGIMWASFLSVFILLSLLLLCREYQWLSTGNSLVKLHFDKDNQCFLEFLDKAKKGPYKIKRSVIFNLALVLSLQHVYQQDSKAIFVACDAVNQDDWRQLRVKLRDPDSWD